tara:strand:+ start:1318 stop:4170 length:2853 start_codon:yes stop_codon:yes gene_type:complete
VKARLLLRLFLSSLALTIVSIDLDSSEDRPSHCPLTYKDWSFKEGFNPLISHSECIDSLSKELDLQLLASAHLDSGFWDLYFSNPLYSEYLYALSRFYDYNSFFDSSKHLTEKERLIITGAALRGDKNLQNYLLRKKSKHMALLKEEGITADEIIETMEEPRKILYKVYLSNTLEEARSYLEQLLEIKEEQVHKREKYMLHELRSEILFDLGDPRYLSFTRMAVDSNRFSRAYFESYQLNIFINGSFRLLNDERYLEAISVIDDFVEMIEVELHDAYNLSSYLYQRKAIMTAILNLTSARYQYEPPEIKDLLEQRAFILKGGEICFETYRETEERLQTGFFSTCGYERILIDTALFIAKEEECSKSFEFFDRGFSIYESQKKHRKFGFSYAYSVEAVYATECALRLGEFDLAEEYLTKALSNIDGIKSNTIKTQLVKITQAKYHLMIGATDKALSITLKSLEDIFRPSIYEPKNLNYLKKFLEVYINSYLFIYANLNEKGLDISSLRNPIEVFSLKYKLFENQRIENLRSDLFIHELQEIEQKYSNIKKKSELRNSSLTSESLNLLAEDNQKILNELYSKKDYLKDMLTPSHESFLKRRKDLRENERILVFNFSEFSNYLIIYTRNEKKIVELYGNKYQVNMVIRKFREGFKVIDGKFPEFDFFLSKLLYVILLKNVEEGKDIPKGSTIYTYGSELNLVPLGVLVKDYDENNLENEEKYSSAKWLINDYAFARIHPITKNNTKIKIKNTFLGFANPSQLREFKIPTLRSAEEEVLSLFNYSDKDRSNLFFYKEATKENFLSFVKKDYETIAIGSHVFPPGWEGKTKETAIFLDDKGNSNFLSSSEIASLDFKTKLIILSACNPSSDSLRNEDISSITKSFLIAGADTILFSNWELETTSASQITSTLFKLIKSKRRLEVHHALREAQLGIIANQKAHPFIWGNFSVNYRN